MTESTALFLASLSHRWAPIALSLPVVFGAATYASGVLMARSRANPDRRVRRLALAARVLAFNLLAFSLLGFLVSISHVGCAGVNAYSAQCFSNLKTLALGTLMYAQDNDDRLPPANRWSDAIAGSVAKSGQANDFQQLNDPRRLSDSFHCPAAESSSGYGMNAWVAGRSISDGIDSSRDTVLLFDANTPSASFAGGAQDLARSRHEGAPNAAFADGHVKRLNTYLIGTLIWTAPPAKPVAAVYR